MGGLQDIYLYVDGQPSLAKSSVRLSAHVSHPFTFSLSIVLGMECPRSTPPNALMRAMNEEIPRKRD
jgi:hypothetical protein